MKKNLFMVAAVALMAMVSCNKEEINGLQGGEPSSITFAAESDATRTSLGEADAEGVKAVNWVSGDQITVNGVLFSTEDEGSRAVFSTTSAFDEAEVYNAVYPAAAGKSLSAVTIPASQKGTFAEASIAVATSTTRSLCFKNAASIVKFQVPAAAKEVTIESDANLAGTFEVTFNEAGEPVIGSVTSGSKKITLTGTFAAGTDYYVAVLPGSHTFIMRIDGYLSKASTKAVATKRAIVSNLQTLPAPTVGTYKIMGLGGDWTTGKSFYKDIDGYLLQDVALTASSEFKFCQEGAWSRSLTLVEGKWLYTYEGNGNLKMPAGTYDIWASAANDAICIVKAGASMPAYTSANKLFHLLFEGYEDNGLYMWNPEGTIYHNWDGAWNNYSSQVEFRKNDKDWTKYCVYPVPANAIDQSCTFLFKWYDRQSMDYTMTINDDKPFWRKGDSKEAREDGSYSLSSRRDIQ